MLRLSRPRLLRVSLSLGLLAGIAASLVLLPSEQRAAAQPPAALPPELNYVPADAAFFVHGDAATIWGGPLGKSVRAADAKTFDDLTKQAKALFGITPDALKSVTAFFPKFKEPRDTDSFGVVLTFQQPYDQDKLKAGFAKALGNNKFTIHYPSDRMAVLLVGLDKAYAQPRQADQKGPLTATIREAASGKHTLVFGMTPANMPDQLRSDELDPKMRAFLPLFKAESIAGFIDLGKDYSFELHVKATNANQAIEAEKALGVLTALIQEGIGMGLKELDKDAAKDALVGDIVALLKAAQTGVKDAKYVTNGTETRVSVKIPGDLPYGTAIVGAINKVRGAAVAAQSANNLKQIAIAMHNYHDTHGMFPPAAVCDKQGKPMLSWRVLILPYVEQDALYRQFKLDEPWDSPNNKKLIAKMPKTYAIPTQNAKDLQEHKTHYRVFVGNGAMFDYLRGPKITDITDGTSNTILVATAAEAVVWTKPDELAFDPDKDMSKLLGDVASGRIQIAMADGSVRAMAKAPSKKTLNAIITKAGGEVINYDDLP